MLMSASATMTFRRFGRSHHMLIRDAEDLRRVLELDEAHWVATGAPIVNLNADAVFLKLLDTDHNGRIMCFEVQDAIVWLFKHLRDTSGITAGSRELRLEAVNTDTEQGRRICASARKMLARLGTPDAQSITLDQVRRVKSEVEGTPVSEAGVVLPEAAEDPEIGQFITHIIDTVGGRPHASGAQGVGQVELDKFLSEARAYLDWHQVGELAPGQETSEVMPLGRDTPAAFALLRSLEGKLEQFFAQCRAVALDERIAGKVGLADAELAELDLNDPSAIEEALRKAPLTTPRADGVLTFADAVNPYYAEALERFGKEVVSPALGRSATSLSEADWRQVRAFFAAHRAWAESKQGACVEVLGTEKLRSYLEGRFADAVRRLIAESAATAVVLEDIRLTEKLILYQHYLLDLANNFVSFPYLYDPQRRAIFEMGTVVMDGRRFEFCVKVENRAAHSAVARTSNMFVMYVEVLDRDGKRRFDLAVPVSSGDKGNLCVGKHGLFVDVNGGEWDARIVQIIENPISITEAVLSPFQRLVRLLTGKIEAVTAQVEKKLDTGAARTLAVVEKAAAAPAEAPKPAAAPKGAGLMAGGLLMGGGVAIAAVASALAYIAKTLAGVGWLKIVLGMVGALAVVLLPVAGVALLKLRRRDLSAILEGCGWAINARMRMTLRQGRAFTRRPAYPHGAKGVRRASRWVVALVVLVVLAVAADQVRRWWGRQATRPAPATAPAGGPTSKLSYGTPSATGRRAWLRCWWSATRSA